MTNDYEIYEIQEKVYEELRPLFPGIIKDYDSKDTTGSKEYYIFARSVKSEETGKVYTFSFSVGVCIAEWI